MEPKSEPAEVPKPESPQPKSGPVMDVVAPPPVATPEVREEPTTAIAQEMASQAEHANDNPAEAPKPPKQPGNGTAPAIITTIVVVLLLAVLAVYAYLKSNK